MNSLELLGAICVLKELLKWVRQARMVPTVATVRIAQA